MGKPIAANATLTNAIEALYFSRAALLVAQRMDTRRTEEDRAFFEAQARTLDSSITELTQLEAALLAHQRGAATEAQAAVMLGDVVLDATVRDGNRVTKTELANKSGLGAQHVFGARVDDLTGEELELEPAAVVHAADRFVDVPDFTSKARVEAALRGAAARQEEALTARSTVARAGTQLESRAAAAIVRASEALAGVEGALVARFPGQYRYCGSFFKPTTRAKRKKD
jgi:hypothetical protein